jgi:hypothetical protein
MTWDPALAKTRQFLFVRVGFKLGEVRLFLHAEGDTSPKHVIQLDEVASFYHNLQAGAEIRITEWPEHGSFGFWLPPDDPHRKIKVSSAGNEREFFLALAKRVEYRFAGSGEAFNWPG